MVNDDTLLAVHKLRNSVLFGEIAMWIAVSLCFLFDFVLSELVD